MGKIALETFVVWKDKTGGPQVHPEPRAIRTARGRHVVTLGDVPLPPGIPHPDKGITMLYGFRDALDVLHAERSKAAKEGLNMRTVSVDVDVDEVLMGTINKAELKSTRFANLKRLSTELQDEVLDRVNTMARKEKKSHADFTTVIQAGNRPDLICKAMTTAPFSHLRIIAYLVPQVGRPRGRQVATLLKTDKVLGIDVRGDAMPFDVELP